MHLSRTLGITALLATGIAPFIAGAAPAETPAADFVTSPEMKRETATTVWFLQNKHLLRRSIPDVGMDELVKDYAAKLDPARMFFVAGDVEKDRARHAIMLDVWLENGNLTVAFSMYRELMERIDRRVAWIEARLDKPFDFNAKDTFFTDRSKAAWPKDEAAADALWEKRLKYDLLLELLGDKLPGDGDEETDPTDKVAEVKQPPAAITPEKLAAAAAKLKKRYTRMRHYMAMEPNEVEELFLNTLAARYDPHSNFFSKQTLEEFQISMRNSLCGVGALLSDEDGYCVVKELLPGGPLEKSGKVKVGDRIVALGENGAEPEDIVGMRLNKIVQRMRGKKGSEITLVLEPAADRAARITLKLNRDDIKLTTQLASARVFEVPTSSGKSVPVGVIDLPAFYGKSDAPGEAFSTTENVEELIGKLKQLNVGAIVLDLRSNGGGLLSEAVDLAGLFIPKGPVVQVKDTAGHIEHLDDTNEKVVWTGPLVVLVSKLSASASEIFAGAMQDHKRALIVGDAHTFGKGSVQSVMDFNRADSRLHSALKITMQKFYLPSGNSNQLKGVPSDITIPAVTGILPYSESEQERPLPWDSIPSSLVGADLGDLSQVKVRITEALVKRLKESSLHRQDTLPEFVTQTRSIAWTGDKLNRKDVSLNFDDRRKERVDDIAFRNVIKDDLKGLEKEAGYKKTEVKLDAAIAQEKEDPVTTKTGKTFKERRARITNPGADADWPDFDVQLRESLRIAGEWAAPAAPIAKNDTVAKDGN